MPHELYRPHVIGPEGAITTPDVMLDRLTVYQDGERNRLPIHRLLQKSELQVVEGEPKITPAYALIGCGGGELLGLAALVQSATPHGATTDILLARTAWRLRNVAQHFDSLRLALHIGETDRTGTETAGATPNAGGATLPRGIIDLYAVPRASIVTTTSARGVVELSDSTLARSLTYSFELASVESDPWPQRPSPRYTVGPVDDEVEQYI